MKTVSHRAHREHREHNDFSVFSVCSVAIHPYENRYKVCPTGLWEGGETSCVALPERL
jgi:hypothetical protein